jgi:hypothetical protein
MWERDWNKRIIIIHVIMYKNMTLVTVSLNFLVKTLISPLLPILMVCFNLFYNIWHCIRLSWPFHADHFTLLSRLSDKIYQLNLMMLFTNSVYFRPRTTLKMVQNKYHESRLLLKANFCWRKTFIYVHFKFI